MKNIKVLKRLTNSIPTAQLNKTAFDYYVDNVAIDSAIDGNAFIQVLNRVMNPDEENYDLKGKWTQGGVTQGGQTQLPSTFINTYTGIVYIYRQAVQTLVSEAIPANLGDYTGRTFKTSFNPMTFGTTYEATNDLNLITHGELQDGIPDQYVPIADVGGVARILAVYNTTNAGFYPVASGEVGTHGKDEFNDYRSLDFWREEIPGETINGTAQSIFIDEITGFSFLNTDVGLKLDNDGNPDPSMKPYDLALSFYFIGRKFRERDSSPSEIDV